MVLSNPSESGPLMHQFIQADNFYFIPKIRILEANGIEVYFVPKGGYQKDPGFYLATQNGMALGQYALIKFALTGDMTSMHKLTVNESGRTIDAVAEITPQYRFVINRSALPFDGIQYAHNADSQLILESLVNYAYKQAELVRPVGSGISKLIRDRAKFDDPDFLVEMFKVLHYEGTVSRFRSLKTWQSSSDIIPDQSPTTIFAKAGNGCMMKCTYCPEGYVSFTPYTKKEFESHVLDVKRKLVQIYGECDIKLKTEEGFINISDIGWLDFGKTDLTSIAAAEIMKEHFPWLTKLGSFIGSSTALYFSRSEYGTPLDRRNHSADYFKAMSRDGALINRLYLGIETGHDGGSTLLRKKITFNQKNLASKLIQEANIRLKAIIQFGVLGKEFYPLEGPIGPENRVTWEEAIDRTVDLVNLIQPYRILESVFQPSDVLTAYNEAVRRGRIVPSDDSKQIEKERKRFRSKLRIMRRDADVEDRYEEFLPDTSTSQIRIFDDFNP